MKREFATSPGEIAARYRSADPGSGFPMPDRVLLGSEIHRQEQRRHSGWDSELFLKYAYRSVGGDSVTVTGRADMVRKSPDSVEIIEIKSVALPPDQFTAWHDPPLSHLIQTRIYAYLCHKIFHLPHSQTYAKLLCINVADFSRREWTVSWSPAEIEELLEYHAVELRRMEAIRLVELRRRLSISKKLAFPLSPIRNFQELISIDVEKAFAEGGDALIEAPPGSGKTLAVLVPALKAALNPGSQLFYATAKGGGRNPVRKAVEAIVEESPELRVVFLSSREEICSRARGNSLCRNCGLESYELDTQISEVPRSLVCRGIFDTGRISDIAESHHSCALTIAHALAQRADLLIGDYNFLFDPGAKLTMFRQNGQLEWYLAGDEAHNLPERARDCWSAEIRQNDLRQRWEIVADDLWRFGDYSVVDELKRCFDRIDKWISLQIQTGDMTCIIEADFSACEVGEMFGKVIEAVGRFLAAAGERLDIDARRELLEIAGILNHFSEIVGLDRERFIPYIEQSRHALGIRCLDPAREICDILNRLRGFVLFSGTLCDFDQFRREIGEPHRPFLTLSLAGDADYDQRLLVVNTSNIITSMKSRDRTAFKVAQTIEKFSTLSPGSILVIFPSYEYLAKISTILESARVSLLVQKPDMTPEERREFKQQLGIAGRRSIGLLVAGGQFSEAEDFPGEACVGVAIVGPCLPPPDIWREALAAYWNDCGCDGGKAAYLIPAVRKVVQAAGRMLRQDGDRGVVLLIDDRFNTEPILPLLPTGWRKMLERQQDNWEIPVKEFWDNQMKPN